MIVYSGKGFSSCLERSRRVVIANSSPGTNPNVPTAIFDDRIDIVVDQAFLGGEIVEFFAIEITYPGSCAKPDVSTFVFRNATDQVIS